MKCDGSKVFGKNINDDPEKVFYKRGIRQDR